MKDISDYINEDKRDVEIIGVIQDIQANVQGAPVDFSYPR
jgi:hypothetical protein